MLPAQSSSPSDGPPSGSPTSGNVPPIDALSGAGAGAGVVEPPIAAPLTAWIDRGPGVLWLRGPEGSGRTTAAGLAIRRALAAPNRTLLGALRVPASGGLRVEEALHEIDQFLRQLGIHDIGTVIDQRTALASKLSILTRVIREHAVLVWLDDFEGLDASSGSVPARALQSFAQGWGDLGAARGRLLITTAGGGPEGLHPGALGVPVLDLEPEQRADIRIEAERATSRSTHTPLVVRIERGLAALGKGTGGDVDLLGVGASSVRLWEAIGSNERRVVELCAASRGPLGRGALRAITPLSEEEEERAVETLDSLGILESSGAEAFPLRLHPTVRHAVKLHLKATEPDRLRELDRKIALHHVEAAMRVGDLRFYLLANLHLNAGGYHDDAYQVLKAFLEDLLRRGFYELARKLLEEAAENTKGQSRVVALGNLAIIHKNAGNLDEAVRLYEQVRADFEASGDQANLARVHHQLGNTHYLRGDLDQALSSYRESLDISREIGEEGVAVATRIQVANIAYVRGEREEALVDYREALTQAQKLGDKAMVTAVRLQIAQLLLNLKRLREAEEELEDGRRDAEASGDGRSRIKACQLAAVVASEQREYERALGALEESYAIAVALGDPMEMAACRLSIGNIEGQRLHFTPAARAYFSALDLLDPEQDLVKASASVSEIQIYRNAIKEKLRELAERVGTEVYARILKTLGRSAQA